MLARLAASAGLEGWVMYNLTAAYRWRPLASPFAPLFPSCMRVRCGVWPCLPSLPLPFPCTVAVFAPAPAASPYAAHLCPPPI